MVIGLLRRLVPPSLELDDIQATILRPRPAPYYGTHALVEIRDQRDGREMMRRLRQRVTSAADWRESRPAWTSVAVTARGLQVLGLTASSLDSFPEAFRAGMAARADRLRDRGPNDPSRWVEPFRTGAIHVMLTVMAASHEAWLAESEAYEAQLRALPGLRVLDRRDFGAQPESRNAFGYRDGFTQPIVAGAGLAGDGHERAIAAGEFILGERSETGVPLPMPTPERLGRNGSYLVLRRYHSDVAAFNRFLHANGATEEDRELLAAKLVGRWRSGAPLAIAADRDDAALGADDRRNNAFDYRDDPKGLQVPLGSHVRRMNPRATELKVLSDVNIRRIIRRSTTYGEPLPPDALRDDGRPRGLDFIAIGARAIDTVEFLQSEWVNSGNFIGRGRERDPLIGVQERDAEFTIPGVPPRRVTGIETFNVLLGGEYFFMPGLGALEWLADPSR